GNAAPPLYTLLDVCDFGEKQKPSRDFSHTGWGEETQEKCEEIFGFCTRESASVSEAHWFVSPRNRSVRDSFKPPRAPRVRSRFEQSLISHRQVLHSAKLKEVASARCASAWYFPARIQAFLRGNESVFSAMRKFETWNLESSSGCG
ncbi:MAG: hypothetical protein G01um101466_810, partial [Parcubacteria group bacterium Gr01-1014_66]